MQQPVDFRMDGAVAVITLHRPEASNALNAEVRAALSAIVAELATHGTARAVVLTAAGEKTFVAGSDIKDMATMTAAESVVLSESILQLHERIADLPQPVICAINGWCLGGGLELALACDIRIAADHARFGFPEARLGIMPGGGGLPRMLRLVGGAATRHLLLTAEFIDAARAQALGLVSCVVPRADLMQEAMALAQQSAALAPLALQQIKRTLRIAESADLMSGLRAEAQACAVCFATQDKDEGMQAFIEKRPARFAAR